MKANTSPESRKVERSWLLILPISFQMPCFQCKLYQQQAGVLSAQAGTVLSPTSHECMTICSLLISHSVSIIQANFSNIYLVITYVHLLTSLFAFLPANLYSVPVAPGPSPAGSTPCSGSEPAQRTRTSTCPGRSSTNLTVGPSPPSPQPWGNTYTVIFKSQPRFNHRGLAPPQ